LTNLTYLILFKKLFIMRTFKFKLLTQAQLETFETSATTLGEMKAEIRRNPELLRKFDVNPNSTLDEVQFIERSTKTTYHQNDAILPTTDATMFVSVIKSKGGVDVEDMQAFLNEIDDACRTELEDFAYDLNDENNADIDLDGSKSNLYNEILEFVEEQIEKAEQVETSNAELGSILEMGYSFLNTLQEYAAKQGAIDSTLLKELQGEAEKIQQFLNKFRYIG